MFEIDLTKMEIIDSKNLSYDILGCSVGENGDSIAFTSNSKVIVSKASV